MRRILMASCLVLAACAGPTPQQATPEEMESLTLSWSHCLMIVIRDQDDGVSDASTIARGTAGACPNQFAAYFKALTRTDNEAVKKDLWARRAQLETNFALPLVLKMRKAERQYK